MNALGTVMLATLGLLIAIAATSKHGRWVWLGVGIVALVAACVETVA